MLCSPECWLNYKQMKKMLKNFETRQAAEAKGLNDVKEIEASEDERKFFSYLRKELNKLTRTYTVLWKRGFSQLCVCWNTIEEFRVKNGVSIPQEKLAAIVSVCENLLLLRNFCVINYCGFTKILKKHDKVTGFKTKDKYMLKMVNDQPFSEHASLKLALEYIAEEYKFLNQSGGQLRPVSRKKDIERLRQNLFPKKSCQMQLEKRKSSDICSPISPKRRKREPVSQQTTKANLDSLLAAAGLL
eukprot:CAMPEP_0203744396 /NCGR_PEP_ID=MMETSP0098-20131031/481_1 /ASSEMBLY_ACC=CAM_ASM_000208 /TAXON_ID=96639 /ORGANISM=" , Strain NY0313808BC1" /LENGTH=243 /DNA_ID=CAMNT_0050631903 /DNA_START=472 /DNA_END=1203 /DNA_ORIENTATION=-